MSFQEARELAKEKYKALNLNKSEETIIVHKKNNQEESNIKESLNDVKYKYAEQNINNFVVFCDLKNRAKHASNNNIQLNIFDKLFENYIFGMKAGVTYAEMVQNAFDIAKEFWEDLKASFSEQTIDLASSSNVKGKEFMQFLMNNKALTFNDVLQRFEKYNIYDDVDMMNAYVEKYAKDYNAFVVKQQLTNAEKKQVSNVLTKTKRFFKDRILEWDSGVTLGGMLYNSVNDFKMSIMNEIWSACSAVKNENATTPQKILFFAVIGPAGLIYMLIFALENELLNLASLAHDGTVWGKDEEGKDKLFDIKEKIKLDLTNFFDKLTACFKRSSLLVGEGGKSPILTI